MRANSGHWRRSSSRKRFATYPPKPSLLRPRQMPDRFSRAVRSRMMAGMGVKNTRPERLLRSYLFGRGLRYRLHARSLPGVPDLVFPKHKAVVFVHGCFWHRHEGCSYFRLPLSNRSFWDNKLRGNELRDQRQIAELKTAGWRVLVVWECTTRREADLLKWSERVYDWIVSTRRSTMFPRGRSKKAPPRARKPPH